jgi:DNA-binding NtrC family response regulator
VKLVNGESMKRVLFVDDDPDILASLRRLFHRDRHRWEMVFALGGSAGLTELERGAFDVVVTDLRMPVVDGPALLRHIATRYPGTTRILLSGGGDAEALKSAAGFADRFLQKPCDFDVLRAAIDQSARARRDTPTRPVRRSVPRETGR